MFHDPVVLMVICAPMLKPNRIEVSLWSTSPAPIAIIENLPIETLTLSSFAEEAEEEEENKISDIC